MPLGLELAAVRRFGGACCEFEDLFPFLFLRSQVSNLQTVPPFLKRRHFCFRSMDGFDEFLRRTQKANVVPVIETMPADLLTPLAVYLKLARDETESFLLESVEGGETLARYSFVGVDPKFTVSGNDRRVTVRDADGLRTVDRGMIDFLRDHFAKNRLARHGSNRALDGASPKTMTRPRS